MMDGRLVSGRLVIKTKKSGSAKKNQRRFCRNSNKNKQTHPYCAVFYAVNTQDCRIVPEQEVLLFFK